MSERWKKRALAAEARVVELEARIQRQAHRIHCQRKAFRDTWEIVEQRSLSSGRIAYARLFKRHKELIGELRKLQSPDPSSLGVLNGRVG